MEQIKGNEKEPVPSYARHSLYDILCDIFQFDVGIGAYRR